MNEKLRKEKATKKPLSKKAKRIILITISLLLLVAIIIPITICSKSCIRSDIPYDYDMNKYITLADGYKGFPINVELASVQAAIDNKYIMASSKEYTVKEGDNVFVDINVYEVAYKTADDGSIVADTKGDEILELRKENYLLENVGAGNYAQNVEASFIGKVVKLPGGTETIHNSAQLKVTLPNTFYAEAWRGKTVFVDMTFVSKAARLGDVVVVDYVGYFLDQETQERVVDTEKSTADKVVYKTFDTGTDVKFYLGSRLSIDGFEDNIVGMKIGDKRSFKITFPDDYSNEAVKGQLVEFDLTLDKIFVPPVYDDDFVKDNLGFDTKKDFEEALIKDYIFSTIYEHLVANSTIIKYPKAEYNNENRYLETIEEQIKDETGVTLDEYILTTMNMTRDEYIKSKMKSAMIYYAIARANEIAPTDSQLVAERAELIEYYKSYYMSEDGYDAVTAESTAIDFVDSLGDTYIYENVLFGLVEEWLINNAVVTRVPIPEGEESITIKIAKDNAPVIK